MMVLDASKREWRHVHLFVGGRYASTTSVFGATGIAVEHGKGGWSLHVGETRIHLGDDCQFTSLKPDELTIRVGQNEKAL